MDLTLSILTRSILSLKLDPDPEAFLGFGADPAYTFNGANLTTWATGNSYFLDNASDEEDWDNPMDAEDADSLGA